MGRAEKLDQFAERLSAEGIGPPPSPPLIEFKIPNDVAIDASTDRKLHSSIKDWQGYEALKLPKSVFFKAAKITSKAFLEANPLVVKVRQNRRIIAYGYQRANRAKEHGELLVQKKFGIRQSLADALEAQADAEKVPQVELVERALEAFLSDAGEIRANGCQDAQN